MGEKKNFKILNWSVSNNLCCISTNRTSPKSEIGRKSNSELDWLNSRHRSILLDLRLYPVIRTR